tara:strand:- start:579 stop:1202 length:624 start_codon:yes stop_codon:yes gene_type:complete
MYKYIPIIIFILYLITTSLCLYISYDKLEEIIPTISVTGIYNPEYYIYAGGFGLISIIIIYFIVTFIYELHNKIINKLDWLKYILFLLQKLCIISAIFIGLQGIVSYTMNYMIHEFTALISMFYFILYFSFLSILFVIYPDIISIESTILKLIIIIINYMSWFLMNKNILKYINKYYGLDYFNVWGIVQRIIITTLFSYFATFYLDY